ncbi:MAG TPA: hypothetical protein VFA88_06930 [Gaiellaceae bacterium]|nr:hypothetical protein [Gaiellaceae bacterium]
MPSYVANGDGPAPITIAVPRAAAGAQEARPLFLRWLCLATA